MEKLAIGILAHVDAGKTTLSEGMILATGETGALLSPDENGKVGERIQ